MGFGAASKQLDAMVVTLRAPAVVLVEARHRAVGLELYAPAPARKIAPVDTHMQRPAG